ncbi:MAG: lamin tail domain-containing protein [Candidatus Liptonbacteria bacterium]|nr:lamin tail domain-containing protein [Candidatus Liptonbacteria bacterium]
MVVINEWLPNPTGADAAGSPAKILPGKTSAGEWIELWNSETSGVDVSGWQVKTGGDSKVILSGQIGPGEYLVLQRTKTKFVLKNSDESVSLYDAGGTLIDQSSFLGSAPEGRSFSRLTNGQGFAWSDPTPGAQNKISLDTGMVKNAHPTGEPLNQPPGFHGIVFLALGTGIVLAAIALFLIKRNEELHNLFFGRN